MFRSLHLQRNTNSAFFPAAISLAMATAMPLVLCNSRPRYLNDWTCSMVVPLYVNSGAALRCFSNTTTLVLLTLMTNCRSTQNSDRASICFCNPCGVCDINAKSSTYMTHSQVPRWTHLKVHLCVVAESWDSEGAPDFQHYRGVEGRARSPGIRLGRGTRGSSLNLHPKQTTKWLVHIREHPWVLGQATGTLDHKTHHGPDSGEAITFPHIVFFTTLRWGYIQMALFPGTPKLESRYFGSS